MALRKHEVIPDVLDNFEPHIALNVSYGSGFNVHEGNELTPTIVKDVPTISFHAEHGKFYTLLMVDPDAPSRADPKYREWEHWCVGNIHDGNVGTGRELAQYIGSGPPQHTGLHRYIFILLQQPDRIEFHEQVLSNKSAHGRGGFSTRKFIEKYHLTPVGCSFYQAQWDDYVPTLYAQLKD